jgi:hypothetical protein
VADARLALRYEQERIVGTTAPSRPRRPRLTEHSDDHSGQDHPTHAHEALSHQHAHYHVTHNFNNLTGGFDHLYTRHSHPHDHPAVEHSHHPHENFESEHSGEAHDHAPGGGPGGAGAVKKAAKKAAPAKKAAEPKAGL